MEIIILIAIYFIPTLIAFDKKAKSPAQVLIVNLFLGWTLLGWVIALVMAFNKKPTKDNN